MNRLDRLALAGRRLERVRTSRSGSDRFTLGDVLEHFHRNTILELVPVTEGNAGAALRPDATRKLKVSLLDGISAIHSHNDDWYEVYRTSPSGDLSRVRIIARSRHGENVGELHMLVSERLPLYYFGEDPIFKALNGEK